MESDGSWNSLVGLVIRLQAENYRTGGEIIGRGKKRIPVFKHPGLWVPASIQFGWYLETLSFG
jgi:hypothetical protein